MTLSPSPTNLSSTRNMASPFVRIYYRKDKKTWIITGQHQEIIEERSNGVITNATFVRRKFENIWYPSIFGYLTPNTDTFIQSECHEIFYVPKDRFILKNYTAVRGAGRLYFTRDGRVFVPIGAEH